MTKVMLAAVAAFAVLTGFALPVPQSGQAQAQSSPLQLLELR